MVMKPEPIFECVESLRESAALSESAPVILLTPQGRPFDQSVAEELSERDDLALICGRYEGVDERVRAHLVTDEISIGDYVLGGGEVAAMVVIEAVSRLLPGVVGSAESPANDSFTTGLLQHPLYTRPAVFRDWEVPEILLSGHHAEIERWQRARIPEPNPGPPPRPDRPATPRRPNSRRPPPPGRPTRITPPNPRPQPSPQSPPNLPTRHSCEGRNPYQSIRAPLQHPNHHPSPQNPTHPPPSFLHSQKSRRGVERGTVLTPELSQSRAASPMTSTRR